MEIKPKKDIIPLIGNAVNDEKTRGIIISTTSSWISLNHPSKTLIHYSKNGQNVMIMDIDSNFHIVLRIKTIKSVHIDVLANGEHEEIVYKFTSKGGD